jgi:hypothetical protein
VSTDAGGAYLDWIGHYYVPAAMVAALAYGAFHENGHGWLLLAALTVVFSLERIPYSARDHVLLGIYRDRPELRGSPPFLRAVLARQGGDPDSIDLDSDYRARRAGGKGGGWLWRRRTSLGQVLVFPGLVNLVTLAVLVDLTTSGLAGDYPATVDSGARTVLVAALGVVHIIHQLRAAALGFQVLRRLP